MSNPNDEDAAAARARRGRNLLLAGALLAFVVIVYIITIAKISGNVGAH
jgi:hypothetical protein